MDLDFWDCFEKEKTSAFLKEEIEYNFNPINKKHHNYYHPTQVRLQLKTPPYLHLWSKAQAMSYLVNPLFHF